MWASAQKQKHSERGQPKPKAKASEAKGHDGETQETLGGGSKAQATTKSDGGCRPRYASALVAWHQPVGHGPTAPDTRASRACNPTSASGPADVLPADRLAGVAGIRQCRRSAHWSPPAPDKAALQAATPLRCGGNRIFCFRWSVTSRCCLQPWAHQCAQLCINWTLEPTCNRLASRLSSPMLRSNCKSWSTTKRATSTMRHAMQRAIEHKVERLRGAARCPHNATANYVGSFSVKRQFSNFRSRWATPSAGKNAAAESTEVRPGTPPHPNALESKAVGRSNGGTCDNRHAFPDWFTAPWLSKPYQAECPSSTWREAREDIINHACSTSSQASMVSKRNVARTLRTWSITPERHRMTLATPASTSGRLHRTTWLWQ